MKRPILIHPDPRLKKVCTPVADISDDLRRLVASRAKALLTSLGLARLRVPA